MASVSQTQVSDRPPIRDIVALGLGLRLFVPLVAWALTGTATVFHSPDTEVYLRLSRELVSEGRFFLDGQPEVVRTPGYPLLLAPGVLLGLPELWAIALQAVLGALTILFVHRIAFALFAGSGHAGGARWAALLYAGEPLSIVYSSKLLAETPFTFLLVLAAHFLVRHLRWGRGADLALSAVALCGSVYLRPAGYFLPAALVVLVAARTVWERRPRGWTRVLWVLGICVGVLGPWQMRNLLVADYAGFSAIGTVNLYFYHAAAKRAAEEGISYHEMQDRLGYRDLETFFRLHGDQKEWSAGKRYRYLRLEAWDVLWRDPAGSAAMYASGVVRTLLDPGAMEYLKLFGRYPEGGGLLGRVVDRGVVRTLWTLRREAPGVFWSTGALAVVLAAYLCLGVLGLLCRASTGTIAGMALLGAVVYFLLASGGPLGLARLRHPVMPVLCVWAGEGLRRIAKRWVGGDR